MSRSNPIINNDFRFKQSIVVRVDLSMSTGKLASQVGHAAVSAAEKARKNKWRWWNIWIKEGQMKVVLKVNSSTELENLCKKAKKLDLPCEQIIDRSLAKEPGQRFQRADDLVRYVKAMIGKIDELKAEA